MTALSRRLQRRAIAQTSPEVSDLALPRIAWEGGPSFYDQYPHAARRGWNSDTFFPVGLWWGGFSTQEQAT